MKKKNKTPVNSQTQAQTPTQTVTPTAQPPREGGAIPEITPSDELQIYYNDAYMREKQRLNEIFGVIPEDAPVVKNEHVEETDMSDYVTLKQYKKMKRRAGALAFFTVLFAVAAIVLAVLFVLK